MRTLDAAAPPLTRRPAQAAGHVVVVEGDVDALAAARLSAAICSLGVERVVLDLSGVGTIDAAAIGDLLPAARAVRAGEQRGFRARLRLQRGRRERRGLHDAGERRRAGRWVEQVVAGATAVVEPAAPADPARRDAALRDAAVQHVALRAADVDAAAVAADAQVARAVDDEARVRG